MSDTPTSVAAPRRLHVALAGFFSCVGLLLALTGGIFLGFEHQWSKVEAEVQCGGLEVSFSSPNGERHILLGLEPPAGAPAWKDGDTTVLACHSDQPQFACLPEDAPRSRSALFLALGFGTLLLALPLWLRLMLRRRAACPAQPRPAVLCKRSFEQGCAYVFAWVLRLGSLFCAALAVLFAELVVGGILYVPDSPSMVLGGTASAVFYLILALVLWLVSRAFFMWDRKVRLSQE